MLTDHQSDLRGTPKTAAGSAAQPCHRSRGSISSGEAPATDRDAVRAMETLADILACIFADAEMGSTVEGLSDAQRAA